MTMRVPGEGSSGFTALLDDGMPVRECELLVVGCGNILRGDDAVGPTLIRRLWADGVPDEVRLVDGGTAGMDVAFQMRGARRVLIVDSASSGADPGTVFRVPGDVLAALPPVDGLHTHSFRWDHALAFARWLLGEACPSDVTVLLVEAGEFRVGGQLSQPVAAALEQVIDVVREHFPGGSAPSGGAGAEPSVEITDLGYLRIDADLAERWFPAHVCGLALDGEHLWLIPLQAAANGGGLLKQRTPAGDRALLVREVLDDRLPVGRHPAAWIAGRGAVRVALDYRRRVAL